MARVLIGSVAAFVVCAASGCVVIVDETSGSGETGYEFHDPVFEEIDAVAKLSFDSNRADAYERIAKRPGLSGPAQAHLVHEAMRHLCFENMKERVLFALIKNRSFSCEGKRAIMDQLEKLEFEATRCRILEAVSNCDPCVS